MADLKARPIPRHDDYYDDVLMCSTLEYTIALSLMRMD
jgi:hypothetical protein